MPDDLDDLDAVLRRTMASLDRQTPEGYFDALPARTLARLDDPAAGEPLEAPKLDDVRELASETRARLSAQRGALDDDVAASAAVWKAVALPVSSANDAAVRASAETAQPPTASQPAAASQPPTVPQPAAALQPATSQLGPASQPATPPPAMGSADDASPAARWAVSQPPTASRSAGAVAASPSPPASSAEIAAQRSASRGRRAVWAAIAGGLAAAGAVGYLTVGRRDAGDAQLVAESSTRVASEPSVAQTPSAPAPAEPAAAHAVPGDAGMAIASAVSDEERARAGAAPSGAGRSAGKTEDRLAIELPRPGPSRDANVGSSRAHESAGKSSGTSRLATLDKLDNAKKQPPAGKRVDAGKASAKGDVQGSLAKGVLAPKRAVDPFDAGKPIDNLKPGDPTTSGAAPGSGSGSAQVPLDQLIGESSSAKPAPVKAKLERTSLSTDDIKRGMAAVARKAQACFAGTQGLAPVRLTVAPSGRVTKATVTGMFAASPTGACVERAVRAARFPPWDGGPQSFNYNYLLAD